MENTKTSLKETSRTVAKYVVGGLFTFLALMVIVSALTGQTKAQDDKKTLQESVSEAQIKYDKLKLEARNSLKVYCESWKDLGLAKRALLKELQIKDPNESRIYDNCEEHVSWYVPDSF